MTQLGSDTPFLLLHVSLPAPRKETTHEFSRVAATFGLPEWCAEQLEQETKSIPLSFVFGVLQVSEKGPETSGHYFVSELLVHG